MSTEEVGQGPNLAAIERFLIGLVTYSVVDVHFDAPPQPIGLWVRALSELEHAGGTQHPAGLAGNQLVADLALATCGFGVDVARVVDGEAAHQAALHHLELVVTPVALGRGTAQFLQIDRREIAAFGHGIGRQLAITATAGTLHKHIDFGGAVAIEVSHLGPHDAAVDRLVNRLDRRLGTGGGDCEVLLGALAVGLHLEADALQLQGLIEGGAGQGTAGQSGGQKLGCGSELWKGALQG